MVAPLRPGNKIQIFIGRPERSDEAMALLEEAVDVSSGTLNRAGVQAAGEIFREEASGLPLSVSRKVIVHSGIRMISTEQLQGP